MKKILHYKKRSRYEDAPDPAQFVAQITNVDSAEVYQYPGGAEEKVLREISFDIRRGECWCLVGSEAFEIELLLEIIGSVRPYDKGRIILAERGMMRKKRRVLPHVFFISDSDVIYPNMNTLEYLMVATANMPGEAALRQAHILQRLLDTGLYYLTLTPIKYLSRAQKAVISLLAASFTMSLLIIFSVPQLEFDSRLAKGIRGITDIITKGGGAVLIGTKDLAMAQEAGTHAAFLISGRVTHSGSVRDVMAKLDKRVYIVTCDQAEAFAQKLKELEPALHASVRGHEVQVFDYRGTPIDQSGFLRLVEQTGEAVDTVMTSHKTLENAYLEALSSHDL